ncbi:MAG: fatty acid desaturase family protein [Rhodospirillales bacterium]
MTYASTSSYEGIGGIGSQVWPLTGPEVLSRKVLKGLRARSDRPGLVHLAIHCLALLLTGGLVALTAGTLWLRIPALLLYGTVIVLTFAPLHECSHGTAFKTRWINYAVGYAIATLTFRPFLYFKYRHAAHHTYTQHADRDPDIVPFPSSYADYLAQILGAGFWPKLLGTLWRGSTGSFNEDEKSFLPESVRAQVANEIRVQCLLYLSVLLLSLYFESTLVLTYWLIPRILGEPVLRAIRMAEHTGTAESPNLLANTRTTLTNPLLRLLYWNMPYHAEHHLASSVPFHALGRMHQQVAPHLQCVTRGYPAVHAEILRSIRRQKKTKAAGRG